MAAVDRSLLVRFGVLDAQIAESLLRDRLVASLSTGFGALALVLSALGLYGVMSYMVARRRPEIGVRFTLGARRLDIVRLVLREAGRLVLAGVVLGVAGALWLSRYAESLLGVAPRDTASVALAAGVDATIVLRGD